MTLKTSLKGPGTELDERKVAAGELDQLLRAQVRVARVHWLDIAKTLYELDDVKGWEALGYDSLRQYLADPELKISMSQGYGMVQAYKMLVVEKQVDHQLVAGAEISNLREVLPAVRRGQVEPERAVADATAMAWSDLRETYGALPVEASPHQKPIEPDTFHYETCRSCGSRIRVQDAT